MNSGKNKTITLGNDFAITLSLMCRAKKKKTCNKLIASIDSGFWITHSFIQNIYWAPTVCQELYQVVFWQWTKWSPHFPSLHSSKRRQKISKYLTYTMSVGDKCYRLENKQGSWWWRDVSSPRALYGLPWIHQAHYQMCTCWFICLKYPSPKYPHS